MINRFFITKKLDLFHLPLKINTKAKNLIYLRIFKKELFIFFI